MEITKINLIRVFSFLPGLKLNQLFKESNIQPILRKVLMIRYLGIYMQKSKIEDLRELFKKLDLPNLKISAYYCTIYDRSNEINRLRH